VAHVFDAAVQRAISRQGGQKHWLVEVKFYAALDTILVILEAGGHKKNQKIG